MMRVLHGCLDCEQGEVLFLNDGYQHLHLQLMEEE
jgi:hypothetical protein